MVIIGWIFSNQLLTVKPQTVDYDQTVQSAVGNQFTITGSAYNVDGIMGGIRTDGSTIGIFSAPLSKDDVTSTSVRTLTDPHTAVPANGEKISLQGNIWTTNPKEALGIDYRDVTYDGPLGRMSAWLVPAPSPSKWTIAVHGIGANKTELLRFIKPVQAAGSNMLIINYRNDPGNPASPDGFYHLGDSEWLDLEAAVHYAKGMGATEIQLYGVSMGGSITENYLKESADVAATNITKVVLDSPALNWGQIIRSQTDKAGYPEFFYYPGVLMTQLRSGVNIYGISTKPEDIKHKTLLIHNADDPTVPQAASKAIAAARPDLITFVDFGTGGHSRAWNHDPARYEQLVTDFLK